MREENVSFNNDCTKTDFRITATSEKKYNEQLCLASGSIVTTPNNVVLLTGGYKLSFTFIVREWHYQDTRHTFTSPSLVFDKLYCIMLYRVQLAKSAI